MFREYEAGFTPPAEQTVENEEDKEQLKHNDLIVPDDDLEVALKILDKAKVACTHRQTQKPTKPDEYGTMIPGEYAISILDGANPAQAADPELVTFAFDTLRRSRVTVRVAMGSESGTTALQ
jgi:hypothetical protein